MLVSLSSFLFATPASAAEGQQQTQLTIINVAAHKPNTTYLPLWANLANRIEEVLNGYQWTVDDKTYQFQTSYTNTEDIANGNLTNYDVLMMFGYQVETHWCVQPPSWPLTIKIRDENGHKMKNLDGDLITNVMIKEEIRKFIEDEGKGYVGHCNGASFLLQKLKPPETIKEWFMHYNNIISTEAYLDWHSGEPILSEYAFLDRLNPLRRMPNFPGYLEPDPTMMYGGGYIWYSGTDPDNTSQLGGVPLDLVIRDNEHPLLSDYLNDTWRVMWCGGVGLYPNGDEFSILADFPSNALEDNESTRIDAWHYVGHLPQGFFNRIQNRIILYVCDFVDETRRSSGDWDPTDHTLHTYLSNKPAFIAFQQPDESGGRVIVGGPHPECNIWWGGKMKRFNNSDNNTLFKGLTYWVDENNVSMNSSVCNRDYNYWFCRREAAWASKQVLFDGYLPPVYGKSQVVNIDPYLQDSDEFTIKCTVGKEENDCWDNFNLSLYYRYNGSNSGYNLTNWTYYDSIDGPYFRFTFDASNANGSGKYYFCSILNTTSTGIDPPINYQEAFPPGPDAECVVGCKVYADFTYSPRSPNDADNITFTDLSITTEDSHIASWDWDFDDGSAHANTTNTTHQYADNGTYVVTLNVTNNQSYWDNISKTIFVRNVPPEADFDPWFKVVWENETVNFTDSSSDVDGTIANWTWKFGDDGISYEKNASHSYSSSGYYVVALEVTDNDNANDIEKGSVLVIDWLVNASLSGNNTCATIQDAIDNASTGEFIYINNGTYTENITINKSLFLFGEEKFGVIIQGYVDMVNPFDYELPNSGLKYDLVSMEGNELLMHFNNDSNVGEDYGSSDVVYDYSGQKNNGTRYGASWNTGTLKGAGCFDFDGSNDQINLSNISGLSGENVTVSAWVYWTWTSGGIGSGSRVSDPIVSQSNNSSGGYCLHTKSSTSKPAFRLNGTEAISSATISKNEWHHIVGIHNETKLKIYVDGILRGNASKNGSGLDTLGFIGFDNMSHNFKGRIDEVAIWNRTLTDDEISIMYHANFGVYMERITIRDSFRAGASPCNHSELSECILINHTIGVLLNNSIDVRIHKSNISNCGTGISIINSTPNNLDNGNRLVDCHIYNVTNGVIVNSSYYLDVIRLYINASSSNITFNNCIFGDIFVYESTSADNIAPDTPTLSGPNLGDVNVSYNFSTCTNDSNNDQILYWFDWGDGNNTDWLGLYWSNVTVNASHSWIQQGGYYVKVKAKDVFNNESSWSDNILFKTETLPPLINSVNDTPDTVGFGGIVNITTNVTDDMSGNWSGIKTVKVNISYPDNTYGNYTMDYIGDNIYRHLFSDTWIVGQYNYTIWAMDNAYNTNNSTGYSFNVSSQATLSIATLKDSYGSNEYINITDPPGNPTGNWTIDNNTVYIDNDDVYLSATPHTITNDGWVEFELLSKTHNGSIDCVFGFDTETAKPRKAQIWRNYTHTLYDYNWIEHNLDITIDNITGYESIGIEHYDEYEVDYGNSNNTKLWRVDISNNSLYIAFLTKTVLDEDSIEFNYNDDVYEQYSYESTFYDWKPFEKNITIEQYDYNGYNRWYKLENITIMKDKLYRARAWIDVPFNTIGKYWWSIKPHNKNMSEAIDDQQFFYLDPWWNTSWNYYRPITIESDFIDNDLVNFSILVKIPDSIADKCDGGDSIKFLLPDNTTELSREIEKWIDGEDRIVWVKVPQLKSSNDTVILMYYNNSNVGIGKTGTVWDSNYVAVWHMQIENISGTTKCYDSTTNNNDGTITGATNTTGKIGTAFGFDGINNYISVADDTTLKPTDVTLEAWFRSQEENGSNGYPIGKACDDYWGNADGHSYGFYRRQNEYHYIKGIFERHSTQQTEALGPYTIGNNTWYYLTLTFDEVSDDGSFYVDSVLNDTEGSCHSSVLKYTDAWDFLMGGSKQGAGGAKTVNTYYKCGIDEVRISNIERNSSWINVSYHSTNYSNGFITWGSERAYRNQSKINNTGSTNISGYLLIQVQYNNSGNWTVDNDTVNETTPRTINSSEQLALDTIFNGLINTNDLTHGNGTYRIYATFRDDDGNILQCDDDTLLASWWEFTVTGL